MPDHICPRTHSRFLFVAPCVFKGGEGMPGVELIVCSADQLQRVIHTVAAEKYQPTREEIWLKLDSVG